MKYRFPSAMGEAEAAGHTFSPDWLEDVCAEAAKLFSETTAPVEDEFLLPAAVQVVLLAIQKCPSKDFILHHEDGRIVKDIRELEE